MWKKLLGLLRFQKTFTWGKPTGQCGHTSGRWQLQSWQEPVWNEGEQRYDWVTVKENVWRCEECRRKS